VKPGQHVSFQHGDLREVVDTEHEPCGCPAPLAVAVASAPAAAPAPTSGVQARPVGGPSSTPADTAFPLAVSEGLTQTPLPPTTPVASPGEVHAQVAVPFRYSGNLPAVNDTTSTAAAGAAATAAAAIPPPSPAAPAPVPSNLPAPPPPTPPPGSRPVPVQPEPSQPAIVLATAPVPRQNTPSRGFFHRVGHFFSRLFGAEQ
jgi:hypothetical protein